MTTDTPAPTATNPVTDPALRALAVATDERLADLAQEHARLGSRHAAHVSTVRHILGQRSRWVSRTRQEWPTTAPEAIAELTAKLAAGEMKPWNTLDGIRALDGIRETRAALAANEAEADKLDQVWADNGYWSRFYLVKANNGHVHHDISGYRCSRQPATAHGWYPQLSGLTEADAVAELGPQLCTSCFPSAPVEWTLGKPKPTRCEGAGQAPVPNTSKRIGMKVYAECAGCHDRHILTANSGIRAHKPKP